MNRIETIGLATLYLGDCREILPTLEVKGSIVSDPPYGISYEGRGGGLFSGEGGKAVRRQWGKNAVVGDDKTFDPSMLLDMPANGRILWGANNYANLLPNQKGWLFWDKHCAPTKLTFAEGEFAWTDVPTKARAFRHLWNGVCRASEVGARRTHPTQKPVALMEWCIQLLPDKSGPIIDPFMGSGTTGVAAMRLSRPFLGIEIDTTHFDTALRRIEAALRQNEMFAAV